MYRLRSDARLFNVRFTFSFCFSFLFVSSNRFEWGTEISMKLRIGTDTQCAFPLAITNYRLPHAPPHCHF